MCEKSLGSRDTEGVGEAEARGKGLRPLRGEQSSQCPDLQLARAIPSPVLTVHVIWLHSCADTVGTPRKPSLKMKHGKNQQCPHTTRETEFTDLAKEVIKPPAASEEKLESRVATTCYLKCPIFNKKLWDIQRNYDPCYRRKASVETECSRFSKDLDWEKSWKQGTWIWSSRNYAF